MQLNAKDGGNRKFILCQIDEPINKKKSKVAYDFCIENKLSSVISSRTVERLNRAGEKIKKEIEDVNKNPELGGSLKKYPI
jgi:adenine-specific DNA-methyltransferase